MSSLKCWGRVGWGKYCALKKISTPGTLKVIQETCTAIQAKCHYSCFQGQVPNYSLSCQHPSTLMDLLTACSKCLVKSNKVVAFQTLLSQKEWRQHG